MDVDLIRNNLKYLRHNVLNLSQGQLAAELKCDLQKIYSHETTIQFARPRGILLEYCDYYNTKPRVAQVIGLLSPDRIINEDLESAYKTSARTKLPPEFYNEFAQETYQLSIFLNNPVNVKLYRITEQERFILRFMSYLEPDKKQHEFYQHVLLKFRDRADQIPTQHERNEESSDMDETTPAGQVGETK